MEHPEVWVETGVLLLPPILLAKTSHRPQTNVRRQAREPTLGRAGTKSGWVKDWDHGRLQFARCVAF